MFDAYDDVMTLDELCEALLIGKNTAYRLLNNGEIPAFRLGRCWKIPKKFVIEFIERKRAS